MGRRDEDNPLGLGEQLLPLAGQLLPGNLPRSLERCEDGEIKLLEGVCRFFQHWADALPFGG